MDIPKIVEILIQDPTLVSNWILFQSALGYRDPDLPQLKISYTSAVISAFDLFQTLLTRWLSRKGEEAGINPLILVLRETGFVACAEMIEAEFGATSTASRNENEPFVFGLAKPHPSFTGREEELEKLKTLMADNLTVAITGLAGIGKTSLVRKFAWRTIDTECCNCVYLLGKGAATITGSITNLAKLHRVRYFDIVDGCRVAHPIAEVFHQVASKFPPAPKTLLIIDNVDEINEEAAQLVDSLTPSKYFVVITSKDISVPSCAQEEIRLKTLQKEDAIQLIACALLDESEGNISSLCEMLENFPLAIHQAISFIKHCRRIRDSTYGIENYMADFQRQREKLLQHSLPPLGNFDYKFTTFTAWKITIDKIAEQSEHGAMAEAILKIASHLNPDDVNLEFLRFLCHKLHLNYGVKMWYWKNAGSTFEACLATFSDTSFNDAVQLLLNFNIIYATRKREKFSDATMHRLIQSVAKYLYIDGEERMLEDILKVVVLQKNLLCDEIAFLLEAVLKYPRFTNNVKAYIFKGCRNFMLNYLGTVVLETVMNLRNGDDYDGKIDLPRFERFLDLADDSTILPKLRRCMRQVFPNLRASPTAGVVGAAAKMVKDSIWYSFF